MHVSIIILNYKIATLTYKILATGQPGYFLNLLNTYQPVHSIRSIDNHLLAKPSVYTSIGRPTFSYAVQQIFNGAVLESPDHGCGTVCPLICDSKTFASPSLGGYLRHFCSLRLGAL